MKRRATIVGLIGFVISVVSALLLWFLYLAWVGEIQPVLVNAVGASMTALATIGLVVLTAWYANSTRRLLKSSQAQVEVMQASYAPVLDIQIEPESNYLQLAITNRGEGTATNIRLIVEIEAEDQIYQYIGKIARPLPSGETISGASPRVTSTPIEKNPNGRYLYLQPRFRYESTLAALPELLHQLGEEDQDRAYLKIIATSEDVINEKEYEFTPLERKLLSTDFKHFESSWRRTNTIHAGTLTVTHSPESIQDYFQLVIRKGKNIIGRSNNDNEIDKTVFEEDIEVNIE